MFNINHIEMVTTVKKTELLAKLRTNLEEHSKIVQEAREGYLAKSKTALESRLEELRTGKIVSLTFNLSPPLDFSAVYRTTIKMLEWNTADEVTLQASEFQQLVLDQWDWSRGFLELNSGYSATAGLRMAQVERGN